MQRQDDYFAAYRILREVGYGLSLEGASAADLVKSMRAQTEPVAQKGKVA
jgi:hypothetical protein